LLGALKHFYGKVVSDEGRTMDFPQIDYGKVNAGLTFSDSDAVKMLINLIGDAHQPLHLGYAGDDMGRNIKVTLQGKETTLYELWDGEMIRSIMSEGKGSFWWGGWTHIQNVRDKFEAEKKAWAEEGAFARFEKWVKEGNQFACDRAYMNPSSQAKLAGGPQMAINFGDSTYSAIRQDILDQLLLAGARTAIVLNDILSIQDASKLNKGSTVNKAIGDSSEDRDYIPPELQKVARASRGPQFSFWVMVQNLGIGAVVVGGFLFLMNKLENGGTQTVSAMVKEATARGKDGMRSGPVKRNE